MADVSRFDQPAQSNVINTFVANPIPFQELFQAGAMRAQQHEQGLNQLNQGYESIYNTKYIPGTRDEATIKEQVSKAGDILNKYTNSGQDLGDLVARREMLREFRTGVDHNTLKNIEASAENAAKYDKLKAEMKAKGEIASYDRTPSYLGWDSRDIHQGGKGVFNEQPNYYNKNYDKDIKINILDKISPVVLGYKWFGPEGRDKVTVEGINEARIKEYLFPDGKKIYNKQGFLVDVQGGHIDPSIANDPDVQTMLRDTKYKLNLDPYTPSQHDDQIIAQELYNKSLYKLTNKEIDHNLPEDKEGKNNQLSAQNVNVQYNLPAIKLNTNQYRSYLDNKSKLQNMDKKDPAYQQLFDKVSHQQKIEDNIIKQHDTLRDNKYKQELKKSGLTESDIQSSIEKAKFALDEKNPSIDEIDAVLVRTGASEKLREIIKNRLSGKDDVAKDFNDQYNKSMSIPEYGFTPYDPKSKSGRLATFEGTLNGKKHIFYSQAYSIIRDFQDKVQDVNIENLESGKSDDGVKNDYKNSADVEFKGIRGDGRIHVTGTKKDVSDKKEFALTPTHPSQYGAIARDQYYSGDKYGASITNDFKRDLIPEDKSISSQVNDVRNNQTPNPIFNLRYGEHKDEVYQVKADLDYPNVGNITIHIPLSDGKSKTESYTDLATAEKRLYELQYNAQKDKLFDYITGSFE